MAPIIGLKLVTADNKSIVGFGGVRLLYTPSRRWRKAPGNGVYLAVVGGLDAGGLGPRIALVEGRKPTGTHAPDGVVCMGEYRVLRVVDGAGPWAEYRSKRAALDAEYQSKRDALFAEYLPKWAALYVEYLPKRDALFAEYLPKWAALFACLVEAVKAAPAIKAEKGR